MTLNICVLTLPFSWWSIESEPIPWCSLITTRFTERKLQTPHAVQQSTHHPCANINLFHLNRWSRTTEARWTSWWRRWRPTSMSGARRSGSTGAAAAWATSLPPRWPSWRRPGPRSWPRKLAKFFPPWEVRRQLWFEVRSMFRIRNKMLKKS